MNELTIQKSPAVFIKLLVTIEFLFAIGPLILTFLFGGEDAYANFVLARALSFSLFLAIIVTMVQILAVLVAFAAWYSPKYQINTQEIVLKRANFFGDRRIAPTPAITAIRQKQTWLGKKLGHGSLYLKYEQMGEQTAVIHNIHDPAHVTAQIEAMIIPVASAIPQLEQPLPALISAGETQYVEFKSSFQWDYRQNKLNKELHLPTMKNIAAFMNSGGGVLVIGVDDDGKSLGLEKDLTSSRRKDLDGFENMLNNTFGTMIGMENRQFMDVQFPIFDGLAICVLTMRPSSLPVYLTHKGKESFYIRTGNSSRELPISKAARYIQTRFSYQSPQ